MSIKNKSKNKIHSDRDFRSKCPLSSTLDLIGDKWSLLILRDLFKGASSFSELQMAPEKISPGILSNRLKALETHDLIKRKIYPRGPLKITYKLTERGQKLIKAIIPLARWGYENIENRVSYMKVDS